MAGEQENTPSAGEKAIADGRLEVGTGSGTTTSLDAGGKPVTKSSDGIMLDVSDEGTEQQGINAHTGTELETADETEGAEGEGDGEEAKGADDKPTTDEESEGEAGEAKPYEPLPDYDPANEEVAAQYDTRFLSEDAEGGQVLNTAAIADEIRANMAKPEGATERPNEGTYKWLKDKLGITRDMVDSHIEGEKAKFLQNKAAMDEVTGGEEVWNKKLAWASTQADGKPGGYTKEQVARFNEAMKKGGADAAEQIELLNERYAKATGSTAGKSATATKPGIGVQRRPASPAKSATTGANTQSGGAPSAKPFANKAEYDKELAAIRTMKPGAEQEAKHRELRARTAVSPWFKAQSRG
jgi:hypothetical protein